MKDATRLSAKVNRVLDRSESYANAMSNSVVGTQHLLLAIASDSNSVGGAVLQKLKITPQHLTRVIKKISADEKWK